MRAQVLLLGPIVLRDLHGAPVEIGGPKRRAVLAALALEESGREAQEWFGEHEATLRLLALEAARLGRHEHAWKLAENLGTLYLRSDPGVLSRRGRA